MVRRTPRSTRTDTLFPDTPLFRSRVTRELANSGRDGFDAIFEDDAESRIRRVTARHGGRPGFEAAGGAARLVRENVHRADIILREPARSGWHQLTNQFLRSEEHTSELQSLMRTSYAAFCLKKTKQTYHTYKHN